MTEPDPILAALAEQHRELGNLLAGLNENDWERPTRCEGWIVADVVLHLAQTDGLAIASVQRRYDEVIAWLSASSAGDRSDASAPSSVDDGAARWVARERGLPAAALRERWNDRVTELRAELGTANLSDRVTWVTGTLSVRTLAATRLAETWIHAGDAAEAVGVELPPADRLRHVARLAWRTLPYAFARAGLRLAGPVAFELTGLNGDDWNFRPADGAGEPATVIRGDGYELCLVAARRLSPEKTTLAGEGPDAGSVLELVRTYA